MPLVFGRDSGVLIWLDLWSHRRARRHPEPWLPAHPLSPETIAVLPVGLPGHLGDFLSGFDGPAPTR